MRKVNDSGILPLDAILTLGPAIDRPFYSRDNTDPDFSSVGLYKSVYDGDAPSEFFIQGVTQAAIAS